jgi:7,8-dihydropterin-6-yl-methyl-4-(beta-D-ribofuranosyl)aminobenzene 5'-phosphate synthase
MVNMKLSVLVDNNTIIDRYFFAEPALSFLIQDQETTVLFDTGYSGIFIQNAYKMGLDLSFLNYLVISHGHFDHTWGLDALVKYFTELRIEKRPFNKPQLVGHPQTFTSIECPDLDELGSLLSAQKLSKHFELQLSEQPQNLSERLTFLGQIPRINDFESLPTNARKEGAQENDILIDDSALVYKSSAGLVIITGCSHAGICNIIEYAKQVCKVDRVAHIIGGLHLLNPPEKQMQGTLAYLEKLRPDTVRACHCTDLNAKIALSKVCNLVEVGVGQCITYG